MFITEQNGAQMWSKMLKENFNVTDSEKLNWASQYAAIHEIHEAQLGVNAMGDRMGDLSGRPGLVPNGGVNPIYATPLNTTGMGNPAGPQNPNTMSTLPYADGNLWNQRVGSGDIPVSTLPMALNIALMTIGLELVPVIPTKGPFAMLSYMDFPYAGGKLNVAGNLTTFDGKGEGAENKPIYVKFLGKLAELAEVANALKLARKNTENTIQVTVTGGDVTFIGAYKGIGRNDGGVLLETWECKNGDEDAAITELFETGEVTFEFDGVVADEEGNLSSAAGLTFNLTAAKADFVQTSADLVDGFANFANGGKEAMTRAQNETGTGNVIGLRLFSKWIQVGAYEVTGTVTRQQLQDLPLYGVDAVGKVMEALQNEITQHINQRILERVFALGVTNAVQQKMFQNVDLNLYLGANPDVEKSLADFGIDNYRDIYGNEHMHTWMVKNEEALTSAENTHTRQRRISSRVLGAANLINTVGRRGRATWIVTNAQVATALQDVSGYVVAPMANTMAQDGSQNLFLAGTLAGLHVYVDPYMEWNDCRICVGRKGDGNSPGVIFMPYILADTVSITAEGTMAPKMLVNSRFAIVEAGFYPELQYYTFAVNSDFGIL
jgi:hypothetical protein